MIGPEPRLSGSGSPRLPAHGLLLLLSAGMALAAPPQMVEGNSASPVRVVIYEDLQCPDCAAFRRMLDEVLLPKYGTKVAFEHRDFPLAKHRWARQAAIVGRHWLAISPGISAKWRRETMARLRAIKPETFEEWVREFAMRHKLDAARAVAALNDAALSAAVQAEFQEGVARGIARTPTALVNGVPFIETFTAEEISQGIDQALKEHGIQ